MPIGIEEEKIRLRGNPEQEMRALRRQMRDLEERRGRAQDAYIAGAFSVAALRGRQAQLDEAKEAVLREMDLYENWGERLRSLEQLRYVLSVRANTWNRVMEVYPDELREAIWDTPWEYDPFASAEREQLENSTPEERRVHYDGLELRVVALSKDELQVSGIFGRETLYICNPSPRPRDTTTRSSASTRTASNSRAAGSPRTWRASACGTSPPWASKASSTSP